ncbi:uncharacterized protein LOC129456537 isoform X2 [Periophthalmus magnuspinnatus]|uniref:uncharacterized protein LOC129456537 isoform X2 n=1 Tax=Periophthalmus magnuspinnatus TaxID=409849 RepID=UPI0024370FD6|nr:uncharacterized protein LOC129456537 isoform X2 [Periophthalmus magnuspinnatus]
MRPPRRRPRPRRKSRSRRRSHTVALKYYRNEAYDGTPHKCATTFMKNKYGKYVKLTKKNGLKLVATDTQDGAITCNLEIWKWNTNIAFCFKYGESEVYVVTEDENKLELTRLEQITDDGIKETIQSLRPWFQIEPVGNHFCIRAANSKKYLTIEENRCITLSNRAWTAPFVHFPVDVTKKGALGCESSG